MPSLPPLAADLVLFDRYRLKSPLGRERTGHTWLAVDQSVDLEVALMIFDDHPDPAKLEQGVKDHMGLTHPSLIRIYEFAGDEKRCAVVMEFVDGKSLRTVLRNRSTSFLEAPEIRRWMEQLLSALAVMHKNGRTHGDINLENLLITDRNDLKMLDIGLRQGRLSSKNAYRAFSAPAGLSPQVFEGGEPVPADDIYAVGACAYELLTGKAVFSGGNVGVQIASKAPSPPGVRRVELGLNGEPLPQEWDEWIVSCMAKERRDRPNAEAVLERIRSLPAAPSATATGTATSRHVTSTGTAAPAGITASAKLQPMPMPTMPATYMPPATQPGMIPVMYAPTPHHVPAAAPSPWGKIITAAVVIIGGATFYFGSWKPSRAQIQQMERDFLKVRQTDNEAPDEVAALKEVEQVIEGFVVKYTGTDIPYTERDEVLRTQAEERHDACIRKIKDLERKIAEARQKEQQEKQARLKAAYEKATELVANANVSGHAKALIWQNVLDDFGDWDNPDDTQDDRMIADSRKALEKYKGVEKEEQAQLVAYTDALQATIDRLQALKGDTAQTAGTRWRAVKALAPLAPKPPGEQMGKHEMLEKDLDGLKKELEDAARQETPANPLTLEGLFANSSYKGATEEQKTGMLLVAQQVLNGESMLQMAEPDGKVSEPTHRAIADFQLKHGIVANAELNDATLWLMGFDGSVVTTPKVAAADSSAPQQKKSTTRRIPPRPAESEYCGISGALRLKRDQMFKRVDPKELRKHEARKAWDKKYGEKNQ